MIIALLGASGSGKSTIENELYSKHGYDKIIPFTSRPKREYEVNGVDYNFIDVKTFEESIEKDLFVAYDGFSQDRLYGTMKMQYKGNKDKVTVMTPYSLKQVKNKLDNINDIVTVFIDANLGTRMKRYIDRCGVNEFNFDDKNEICMRVERDFTQFKGIEEEVDLVLHNNENTNIEDLVNEILEYVEWRKM